MISSEWRAGIESYASGVRADAAEVTAGRSLDVRGQCPDCGRAISLRTKGEDGRCRACTDLPMIKAAARPRTPGMLRTWARIARDMLAKQPASEPGRSEVEQWCRRWEREADEMEGKV